MPCIRTPSGSASGTSCTATRFRSGPCGNASKSSRLVWGGYEPASRTVQIRVPREDEHAKVGTVKTGAVDHPALSWWAERACRLYERAPSLLENAATRCLTPVAAWSAFRIPVAILRGHTRAGPAAIAVAGTP